MAKAIHKSCCLQAGASEAVALIEKVISEEQTWGTYKIDKTETDGAYAAFVCTPVWTFSLYHNSFVPDTHITVREDNGKSQIGFDFTQCRSAKLAGILINSFLLLFAVILATSTSSFTNKYSNSHSFRLIANENIITPTTASGSPKIVPPGTKNIKNAPTTVIIAPSTINAMIPAEVFVFTICSTYPSVVILFLLFVYTYYNYYTWYPYFFKPLHL